MKLLDTVQVILWSIAYLLMIVNGIKHFGERKIVMPLIPGSLCLAWEMNALIHNGGMWTHILWLSLDAVIFFLNVFCLRKARTRLLYCAVTVCFFEILALIFLIPEGMLFSSFIINLFIALGYIVHAKEISRHGKIWIAFFKWIGTCVASIYYLRYSALVLIMGIVIFLLDLYYLSYCITESQSNNKVRKK